MEKREYTEVLEILNAIPSGDYLKIPTEKIEFFEDNKDPKYVFEYNRDLSLEEQNVSRETMAILVQLYKDYIALPEEKDKIEEILRLNYLKNEYEKKGIYKDDIFAKQTKKKAIVKVEEHQSWIKRIILKIKMIFTKRKI